MIVHWWTRTIIVYLEAKINGYGLLSLDRSMLDRFKLSFGFQLLLMNIIEELVNIYIFHDIVWSEAYNVLFS